MIKSSIKIGNFVLDDSYAPLVNLTFEYFRTPGEEIIGGLQKFTISGVVSESDTNGKSTGAGVMSKLANIRLLGKKTKCVDVEIPSFYSGKAKITNVNIEQGSDPSWVNQGQFSIELSAPLESIPTNRFNITAADSVREISKSETIEIGEDAHGFVFLNDNTLSKTFVTLSIKASVTCSPLCPDMGGDKANTIKVLEKLLALERSDALSKYNSWNPHLQSRSLELSSDGTASFSSVIILLPPNARASAFVELDFEHSQNYQDKQENKKTSGTITGLAKIPWTNLIDLSDTSSASKLSNAESVFGIIKSKFVDLSKWEGLVLSLEEKPRCPIEINSETCKLTEEEDGPGCIEPINSTISKSRTEGTISFSFEWASKAKDGECSEANGKKLDVTVDIVEPQATLIEHVVPDVGTLLQNLNCKNAKTFEFTSTVTAPEQTGCSKDSECSAETALEKVIREYIENPANWLIISDSKTKTTNSVSLKRKYIRKCLV